MRKKISSWFLLIGLVFALAGCGAGGGGSADNPADGGADTTPPTVSSVSPTSGATSVAINSTIIATFSESVDGSTVDTSTFIVKDSSNNIVGGTVTSGSPTATFTPSLNLTADTTYTVIITTGIEDSAGNAMTAEYTWTFTTGSGADTTGPSITGHTPSTDATGVAVNSTISVVFSESIDPSTLDTTTFTLEDSSNNSITGTVSYDDTSKTATFTPFSALSYDTTYYVNITQDVEDMAGNMLVALEWMFTTASAGTAPSAPTSLTVISATKTQAQLSWMASTSTDVTSYTVERASEGSTTFTEVATGVAATAYTDTTINQYTAYTYRVRAVNASGASNPSNEDKAGPPPTGFNVAVEISTSYAFWGFNQVSMVLDENDDPMMTYVQSDLNRNGNNDDDSYLYFVKWDRTNYNWTAPLAVDMVGQINNNQPHRQVSIVRDASTGTIGIAYQAEYDYTIVNQLNDNKGIKLALSTDGGSTWSTERVDQISGECSAWGNADPDYCDNNSPSLVMSGGDIHIAYTAYRGLIAGDIYHYYLVRYATRAGTSGAFSETNAPWITGTEGRDLPVGLALDGNGQAGLAYMVISTSDTYPYYNNSSVVFWRPGDASATKITDSSNAQNDFPSISLAFDGTKPRIAYHLMRDLDGDNEGSDEPYYLYFSASDDGVTWGSPVGMPFDGGHKTGLYQSIDTGSQGQTAIAAMLYSSSGSNTCGSPKLYSSSDNVNWTVCGADADDSKDADSYYISLNFAGNDKLYLAFGQYTDASSYGGFKSGLILWREP